LTELGKLTGINFFALADCHRNRGALISFDRPELSPCLEKLGKESPAYTAALALIRRGQEQLKTSPEADRPGFIPADYAQKRQKFYDQRQEVEREVRKAIHEGRKIYDPE
jgi:hypothetical protein